MWTTFNVLEPLHMQWMVIWNHRQPVTTALVDPDFDSQLCWGLYAGHGFHIWYCTVEVRTVA